MDVEPFVNHIEEGEEPSSVRAGKSNVRYLIFTYNHNWYFWLLFPCLTELYFLIARLLSQGPCQHASEVIIIISIVLGSIQLTSLFNLWPTGAATGAGDAWGGFTAYFTNVFCMQTMLSISIWATLAFPANITTIILFSYELTYIILTFWAFCVPSANPVYTLFYWHISVATKNSRLARKRTRTKLRRTGKLIH